MPVLVRFGFATPSRMAEINFSCEHRLWKIGSTADPEGLRRHRLLTAVGLEATIHRTIRVNRELAEPGLSLRRTEWIPPRRLGVAIPD